MVPGAVGLEGEPLVFVLDGSRSESQRGGLASQLSIVRGYLAHVPSARVELIVYDREARRIFGKFIRARDFDAAMARSKLVKSRLRNGSALDRGAALAAQALVELGQPGRILLFSDYQLSSRFQLERTIEDLARGPSHTSVHVIFPSDCGYPTCGTSSLDIPGDHFDPVDVDLGEIARRFDGAAFFVSAPALGKVGGSIPQKLKNALAPLVRRPHLIEDLALDAKGLDREREGPWHEWSWNWYEGTKGPESLREGESARWSGSFVGVAPNDFVLTGWSWRRQTKLTARADDPVGRRMLRLATADTELMECLAAAPHYPIGAHKRDALAAGFLSLGLLFEVPGAYPDLVGQGEGGAQSYACTGPDILLPSLPRSHEEPPVEEDIVSLLCAPLAQCGLTPEHIDTPDVRGNKGEIVASIETRGSEIVDLRVEGGGDDNRECAERVPWDFEPARTFNQALSSTLVRYTLRLRPEIGSPVP